MARTKQPLSAPNAGAATPGRRVGENLRRRRAALRMSLGELSEVSGVSRAALSQIESCRSNPTVGVLWKIAAGLGIPFAELLGERRRAVEVVRLQLAARAVHASEAHGERREVVIVLAGSLRLRVADATYQLQPGDSIAFDADRCHSYESPGPDEGPYHDVIVHER
jgi:transcriptional regulator with XRE-family HTH domain